MEYKDENKQMRLSHFSLSSVYSHPLLSGVKNSQYDEENAGSAGTYMREKKRKNEYFIVKISILQFSDSVVEQFLLIIRDVLELHSFEVPTPSN